MILHLLRGGKFKICINYSTITIGNVSKRVQQSSKPWLIPSDKEISKSSQTILQHLKWMLQKDIMHQDVFLIGHPGPLRRRLAMMYCELAGREIEHLVLSRDTTEGDIKQRKEIISGSSVHVSGPAVRAAREGRVLIIEGIERAEQNLLPVLNNLLENREMHLEDGRFLVSPERYDSLLHPSSNLIRTDENFWVIALGVPVPPNKGYPLDPPLRSRFQARLVQNIPFSEQINILKKEAPNTTKLHSLLSFATFFEQESAKSFPHLPADTITPLSKLLANVPGLDIYKAVQCVYPLHLLLQTDSHQHFYKLFKDLNINKNKNQVLCKGPDVCGESSTALIQHGASHLTVPAGNGPGARHPRYISTLTQDQLLSDMLLSHSVGDICLTGPSGCGKSVCISQFAAQLGYTTDTVVLYADMTSRDLLQRRHTDIDGNTLWENSPLVTAALQGTLLILDGVDKLHHTALTTLSSLCEDRELHLPNGTRLISQDRHSKLAVENEISVEELCKSGVLPIHPSFRIIGTAGEGTDWLTSELLSMWHYHYHPPLTGIEEERVLQQLCPSTSDTSTLLTIARSLRSHSDPAVACVGETMTLRRVVALAQSIAGGQALGDAIHTTILTRFMPVLTRNTVTYTLEELGVFQSTDRPDVQLNVTEEFLSIGNVTAKRLDGDPELIPSTLFYQNVNQMHVLQDLLRTFNQGSHILLVGNQGVGKNKVVDQLLYLLRAPRQYLQLHRDSTVQSLTVQPTINEGRVEYSDSALVRAVRSGHVLVVDEADKAPTQVTSVLRTLLDTGSMWLSDGRQIVSDGRTGENIIQCHPDFRTIFLANRPGFPFLGNDFYSVMGDLLSCLAVDNPDPVSEMELLVNYGPDVSRELLTKLIGSFSELRQMSDAGTFLYPYSTRELVNIVKHLQEFPGDGVTQALCNVLDFEQQNGDVWDAVIAVLHKHGVPFGAHPVANVSRRHELKAPQKIGHVSKSQEIHKGKVMKGHAKSRGPFFLSHRSLDVPIQHNRAEVFSERRSCRRLPLPQYNTNYTLLMSDSTDTIHAMSSLPDTLYTLQGSEGSSIDLSPALSHRPNLTAATAAHLVLLSDSKTPLLLLVDTTEFSVKRIDLNFSSIFTSSKDLPYTISPGREGHAWLYSDNILVNLNIATNAMRRVELPYKIGCVTQLQDGVVIVRDTAGCHHLVCINKNNFTSTQLEFNTAGYHDNQDVDTWLHDTAADITDNSGVPLHTCDVMMRGSQHLLSEHALTVLQDGREPDIRLLEAKLPELTDGVLTQGQSIHYIPDIPAVYREKGQEKSSKDSNAGYLAVIDTEHFTVSFLALPYLRDSKQPCSALLMAPYNTGLITLSSQGLLQEWEISPQSLSVSYTAWREMVGEPGSQLTLERHSGLDVTAPKHGKVDPDNTPHIGGNTWAGGTGGRDTAGLGGKGGPYRLDAGHDVHQLSDEEKADVPEEVTRAAREMGRKAFEKRLEEIKMSEYDAKRYNAFVSGVQSQISALKQIAAGLEAKQGDRVWLKNQTDGELDDSKLVEGLTGERSIYKRRGIQDDKSHNISKPKHVTLLVDVSGSMYRFNGLDQRLQRELEVMAMVMEGLEGSESRLKYDIIGHSGESYHINFVKREQPPNNEKLRLQVLEEMHAHSQFCWSGDNTVEALEHTIQHAAAIDADDRIVVAFSDANLERYFIRPSKIASLMRKDPSVAVYMIFIGSLGDEAAKLRKTLPAGKSFVTMDTKDIPKILQQIFTSALIR